MFTNPKKLFFLTALFTIAGSLLVANSPGGYAVFGWIALATISTILFIRGSILSRKHKNNVFLVLNVLSLLTLIVLAGAVWLIIAFQ